MSEFYRKISILILFYFIISSIDGRVFSQSSNFNSEEQLDKARKVFALLSQNNSYTENLQQSDLNILPIGLRRTVDNMEVTIAIDKAIFYATYTELSVFAKAVIPEGENGERTVLFFGANGIKLSHEGSIIGDAKLILLRDIDIPFNNGNTRIIFKGGYDETRGKSQSGTFMAIDCKGFKELGLEAEVVFPKTLLKPLNEENEGVVKGHFSTIIESWNDLLVHINLPSFYIVGLDDFEFNLKDIVLDFSDKRNDASIRFPMGYEQKYTIPGAPSLWRGVYARDLSITLPNQFSDK